MMARTPFVELSVPSFCTLTSEDGFVGKEAHERKAERAANHTVAFVVIATYNRLQIVQVVDSPSSELPSYSCSSM